MDKKLKIYIAGQEGMVGSCLYKFFKKKGYKLIDCSRNKLDLINQKKVQEWFSINKPEIVINAAGKVGGIKDNSDYKVEYIYKNTLINFNLIKSSIDHNIKKFINLGSACIYPKITKQPIKEEYLLSSYLEKTNEAYALSKISSLKMCSYLNDKYKIKRFITLQPANLYGGRNDNFDLQSSHVIPALINKFCDAKLYGKKKVEIWGSGKIKREFLHVEDLCSAIYVILKNKIQYDYINVGSNEEITIKNLSILIKRILKYNGAIVFNKSYPDGVPRRLLDSSKIKRLNWKPKIKLEIGLRNSIQKFFKTIINKD
jgi:GDP-L-fucose synthase